MSQQFILPANDAALRETRIRNLVRFLSMLPLDQAWAVESKRHAKSRSGRSNSYMWAALYAPLVTKCGYTPAEWHEYMLISYFGERRVELPGGRVEIKPARTTTTNEKGERDVLPQADFASFLEHVQMRGAEHGVWLETEAA